MTAPGAPATDPVPDRYRGVWARTLLETPAGRDDTTFVRWLQASRWHADLRVPAAARAGDAAGADRSPAPPPTHAQRALQQGFSGVTAVETSAGEEVCTWHRRVDFQPPSRQPDAGRMVFETPDRVIETGVHGPYLEVWERLPDSTGRFVVLQSEPPAWPTALAPTGAPGTLLPAPAPPSVPALPSAPAPATVLLIAGAHAMRVRPRLAAWPATTLPGDSLADVMLRDRRDHPRLLDFEISFGRLDRGVWSIERSTLPALEGRREPWRIERTEPGLALANTPGLPSRWSVVEWDAAGCVLA